MRLRSRPFLGIQFFDLPFLWTFLSLGYNYRRYKYKFVLQSVLFDTICLYGPIVTNLESSEKIRIFVNPILTIEDQIVATPVCNDVICLTDTYIICICF